MALVSTIYPPEIWANESLMVLSDNLVMAPLVHRGFEAAVAQVGDVVHTRKPVKLTAKTWGGQTGTDANETIEVENPNAKSLSISLDTLVYTAFIVEDRDASTSIKDLRDEFMVPAVQPLAQKVDDDIMTEFTSASSTDVNGLAISAVSHGTVGLNATFDADEIITARKQLAINQCPVDGNLSLVLCPTHEAALLGSSLFQEAQKAGSTAALRDANLGRAFGFNVYMSQNVPAAVDTDATYQSLAFHRNAIALVSRPLQVNNGEGVRGAVASLNGVSIRVETAYDIDRKGYVTSYDVLYGVQLLDSKLAVIINP